MPRVNGVVTNTPESLLSCKVREGLIAWATEVASGEIKVKNGEITFKADTVAFKDGSTAKPDIVVFATGYTSFLDTVRVTLDEKWIKQMSTAWSLDEEGKLGYVFLM